MKKETIEEVAERFIKKQNFNSLEIDDKIFEAILFGAEWQAERMYSEEEVMDMFHNLSMHLPLHYEFLIKEQFKNK